MVFWGGGRSPVNLVKNVKLSDFLLKNPTHISPPTPLRPSFLPQSVCKHLYDTPKGSAWPKENFSPPKERVSAECPSFWKKGLPRTHIYPLTCESVGARSQRRQKLISLYQVGQKGCSRGRETVTWTLRAMFTCRTSIKGQLKLTRMSEDLEGNTNSTGTDWLDYQCL